jgi:hypothetical protein
MNMTAGMHESRDSSPAWGARGREFESRHPDHIFESGINGLALKGASPFGFVTPALCAAIGKCIVY